MTSILDFITNFWGPVIVALVLSSAGWITLYYQFIKDRRERVDQNKKIANKQSIEEKDSAIERANKVNEMYEKVANKFEQRVKDLEDDRKMKDGQIKDLNTLVAALEIKVTQRDAMITDRDKRIVALENDVKEIEGKLKRNSIGIRKLINQLISLNIVPSWRPDSDYE
jgi:hypothetical protein